MYYIVLGVCGGSRFLLYTPTIAQDCWLSRADINKLIKLKYYQAHNELISMAIMPVISLLQIVWISLPRVFILLKCHHFGISRSFREICFEYSLMLRSSHLRLLNAGKVEIWTPGFLCGLCMLNGRIGVNNFTHVSHRGRSVVDYVFVPYEQLLGVENFEVCLMSDLVEGVS